MESDPQKYVEGLRRNTPDALAKGGESGRDAAERSRKSISRGTPSWRPRSADILDDKMTTPAATDNNPMNLRVLSQPGPGAVQHSRRAARIAQGGLDESRSERVARAGGRRWKRSHIGLESVNAPREAALCMGRPNSRLHPPVNLPEKENWLDTLLQAHDPEAGDPVAGRFCPGDCRGEQRPPRGCVSCSTTPIAMSRSTRQRRLARRGDPRAIGTLAKMLDPAPLSNLPAKPAAKPSAAGKAGEQDDPDLHTDPTVIMVNGLRASRPIGRRPIRRVDLSRLEPADRSAARRGLSAGGSRHGDGSPQQARPTPPRGCGPLIQLPRAPTCLKTARRRPRSIRVARRFIARRAQTACEILRVG